MWTWSDAPIKIAGATIGVVVALVGGTYKGVSFVDERYAHQDDLEMVNMRLDEKMNNDRVNQVQQRIWLLEKEYGMDRSKWPQSAQQEVKDLELKKEKLEKHLEKLDEIMIQRGMSPNEVR